MPQRPLCCLYNKDIQINIWLYSSVIHIPESCWANSKKQKQYSMDVTNGTLENYWNDTYSAFYQKNLALVFDFLTLQDKHIQHKYIVGKNNFYCTCCKTVQKNLTQVGFSTFLYSLYKQTLPFQHCTYIVYCILYIHVWCIVSWNLHNRYTCLKVYVWKSN